MKLNAKAACTWLAVPLAAMAISACGGDDGVTPPPEPETGLVPGTIEYAEAYPECGDGFVTGTEQCEDGPNCNVDDCMDNVCGDGFVGPDEACDDGNTTDGDGCQSDCADPDCGDGIVDDGEACDDGNSTNNDGCTNTCEEPACGDGIVQAATEECDEGDDNGSNGSNCTDSCEENTCGDGHVGPGEACDDMNDTDGDDCTNACGLPTCGDGIEQAGEECDDGNGNDRDECLASCVLNVCGDGQVLAGTEDCDDGNSSNGDTCLNTCVSASCGDGFEGPGEACDEGEDNSDTGSCTTTCATAECGDGEVQDPEECDDGNTNNADGCSNTCVAATCGDGIRQDPEECDDGNTANSDACTNDCTNAVCGDGFVGPGEACDDGNLDDGDGCQSDCADPDCGDGVEDAGEECDDGNDTDDDACSNTCTEPVCGDGIFQAGAGEECDDGNTVDGDQCTNSCTNAACGDGVVGPNEGCDDGNTVDGDGCQANCAPPGCGDGIQDAVEACDDGNQDNTDGCTNTCAVARCGDGFTQAGVEGCDDGNASNFDACLNTCVDATCGDGFEWNGVEDCDLGANNGPGSQCSTSCTPSNCGDGALDPGEECDDGNNNNNDSCTTMCLFNVCGDGAVYIAVTDNDNSEALEECDDANTDDSDLCLATCRYNRCADGVLLTNNESEPYDDPDGTGVMTASRGGLNDVFHSGPAMGSDNLTAALLSGTGMGGTCVPSDACVVGMLHDTGVVPNGSGLSLVNILHIDNEECDDGNLTNTDACLARNEDGDPERECRDAYCNDGEVQAGAEECDDGCGPGVDEEDCDALRDQNDSCLDTCDLNSCGDGWLYTTNTSGSPTPPLEACDDGNTVGGDGCLANCSLPTCGNGVIDFTVNADGSLRLEECDAGASNSDAGNSACSTTCRLTRAANPGILDYTCGNGVQDTGEECDDANADNNDSCLNNCMYNKCGDGARYIVKSVTNSAANPNRLEQCDDANSNNNDSCLDTCRWNTCGDDEEYRKETDGNPLTGGPDHGNGLNENIDDVRAGDCVGADCSEQGDNTCNNSQNTDVEGSEALYDDCDAPDTGGDTGNTGVPDEADIPEECDDGNAIDDDLCSNVCEDAECGDGILQAGEECDDGNEDSEDGCHSLSTELSTVDADDDGVEDAVTSHCESTVCENVDDEDEFDDCVENCELNARSCKVDVCGDWFKGPFEACDDGDSDDNDWCHNNCSFSSCGNGMVNTGLPNGIDEDCDDGNTNNNDACTNICLFAACGDGILQIGNGEECDDGNDDNTDDCTSACTLPICGDGVRQGAEQCDPGRAINGNEELNLGTYLYANHDNVAGDDPDLSDEDRDDGYIDEPFFCDPNTCRIRCNAAAGTNGRRWKENNSWCVFAAEVPGFLNDAQDFLNAAYGSYTKYDDDGEYDALNGPELDIEGWAGARQHCQDYGIGADLVVVRNTTENDQLLGVIDQATEQFYYSAYTGGSEQWWWLGLNDVGTQVQEPDGVWQWLDGAPADTYRNWSGPPDVDQRPDDQGSDEDCAAMTSTDVWAPQYSDEPPGTWNDLVCQYQDVRIACEFQIPPAAP